MKSQSLSYIWCENMKFTLAILSLVVCSSLGVEDVKKQKRSLGLYDQFASSYGLPVDTSISSHTHTHTTSVIEKPVIISAPAITTTKIISPAIRSTYLPPYAYSDEWPSTYARIYSNKLYPSFGKYFSSGYGWPATTFSKPYIASSPIFKSYRW